MSLELNINGYLDITIFDIKTNQEVSEEIEAEVQEKLRDGSLVMGINTQTISSIEELNKPLYKVSFEATDALSYEWE